jgi:hypothetical protein
LVSKLRNPRGIVDVRDFLSEARGGAMGQCTVDEMQERIVQLERQVVLSKKAALVAALGVITWAVLGSGLVKPLKQVAAEKLVLKDAKGTVRASLGLRVDGGPELVMFSESGKRVLSLQAPSDNSSSLDFYDRNHVRVSLSSSPGGNSLLSLVDPKGRSSTNLYMTPETMTGLSMRSTDGQIDMRAAPEGTARVSFADRYGNEISAIGTGSGDGPTKSANRSAIAATSTSKTETCTDSPAATGSGPGARSRILLAP